MDRIVGLVLVIYSLCSYSFCIYLIKVTFLYLGIRCSITICITLRSHTALTSYVVLNVNLNQFVKY